MDVQMPDGTIIRGVPDGVTKSQLVAKYQKHVGAPSEAPAEQPVDSGQTGIGRTIVDQGVQGLTFGFGDELSDRAGALYASLLTDEKYKDLLDEARANSKKRLSAQFEKNPATSIAANLAGGLVTGGAGASALKTAAPKAAAALESYAAANPLKTAAGVGAASGALYGAGSGTGGLEERAPDTLLGGTLGMVAGPAVAALGKGLVAPLADRIAKTSAGKAVKAGINNLIQKPANEMTDALSGAGKTIADESVPEASLTKDGLFSKTAGQRTQDANLQRLENDARAGTLTKESENAIRQADIQQNREFHSYLGKVANGLDKGSDPNVLIEGVTSVLKKNAKSAKQGINNAYDFAREGKGVKIGSEQIRQGLWKGIADIRRENVYDLSQMPKATGVLKRLANYSRRDANSRISAIKLGEMENWRKQTTNAINSTQDPTERKFLGEMVKGYDTFMEKTAEEAVDIGDANAIRAFRIAVGKRREYGRLFETNKFVEEVVGGQKSVDDTVKNLMGTGSIKGKKEMANNLDAIVKASGKEAEKVQNDLRQAFTLNVFRKAIVGYEPNNPSMERLSPAKLKTELENLFVHQKNFSEKLYGKDARKEALRAIRELDLISSTQAGVKNPSGSGEWLGRFLKTPGVNRIPGTGLVGKALEAQNQHTAGAQVTKGLADFIKEQSKPTSAIWSTTAPVGAAATVSQ